MYIQQANKKRKEGKEGIGIEGNERESKGEEGKEREWKRREDRYENKAL